MISVHLKRLGFSAAVLGICVGLSMTSANAASVVVNGTFDDQSGWTGTFINRTGVGGFPTIDTEAYYHGGSVGFREITQTYTLTAADLLSLGSTGLDFTMSADLFGFDDQADFSTFTADFRDAGNSSLGTASLTSTTNDPGDWAAAFIAGAMPNFQELTGTLNSLTRSILFSVSSTRLAGSSNDGYLDNAFFELRTGDVAAVPLPAAFPLFAGGLGLMGLMGWRRRRKAEAV